MEAAKRKGRNNVGGKGGEKEEVMAAAAERELHAYIELYCGCKALIM